MNIFVGNLPMAATEEDLQGAFSPYGAITRSTIIKDKMTGESRGFGFVEMADEEGAKKAIAELNGAEWAGRILTVNIARPRESNGGPGREGGGRPGASRGGFGGGSGGGGGGYGGGGGGGAPRRDRESNGPRRF